MRNVRPHKECWQYVPLHRPGSKFLKEAVSKLQWRALTVSACNAVGPPYRPFMSWDRSTDAWTTLEATTAFIATRCARARSCLSRLPCRASHARVLPRQEEIATRLAA